MPNLFQSLAATVFRPSPTIRICPIFVSCYGQKKSYAGNQPHHSRLLIGQPSLTGTEGYFIPKGTTCIPNVWYMNRDPGIYGENAAHFVPARHLEAGGDIAPGMSDAKEETHVSYGFVVDFASVGTWPTTRCSSASQSCCGQPRSGVRKTSRASFAWMALWTTVSLC